MENEAKSDLGDDRATSELFSSPNNATLLTICSMFLLMTYVMAPAAFAALAATIKWLEQRELAASSMAHLAQ